MQDDEDTLSKLELYVKFEVTAQTGENVKFEGPVSLFGIRDWFDRAALGVSTVFGFDGPCRLKCTRSGMNKINSIKLVREYSNCGLKEAKDFIEGNYVLHLPSLLKAKMFIKNLEELGNSIVPASAEDNDIPLLVTR